MPLANILCFCLLAISYIFFANCPLGLLWVYSQFWLQTKIKKAWEPFSLLVLRIEAFALPSTVERATQGPRRYVKAHHPLYQYLTHRRLLCAISAKGDAHIYTSRGHLPLQCSLTVLESCEVSIRQEQSVSSKRLQYKCRRFSNESMNHRCKGSYKFSSDKRIFKKYPIKRFVSRHDTVIS